MPTSARSGSSRWLLRASGFAVAALCLIYALVLAAGLLTLPAPDRPIQQPWFTLMEWLILLIAPAMVAFSAAVHGLVAEEGKSLALLGVIFMGLCAGLTCVLHFSILMLSRQPGFVDAAWARQVFAFEWPSLVYALDILAWDVFFALGALCLGGAITGSGRAALARKLLYFSGILALVGLIGVPLADMSLRNIGILGYAVVFPVAAAVLARDAGRSAAP
ncbi:MAG: hypothetical protein AB7E72_10445 [Lysobacterales bacterium]